MIFPLFLISIAFKNQLLTKPALDIGLTEASISWCTKVAKSEKCTISPKETHATKQTLKLWDAEQLHLKNNISYCLQRSDINEEQNAIMKLTSGLLTKSRATNLKLHNSLNFAFMAIHLPLSQYIPIKLLDRNL